MKTLTTLILGTLLVSSLSSPAEEKNGVRLSVQKTTLDKIRDRNSTYYGNVNKALALRVLVKNIGLKDLPAGKVEYTVIVKRWGSNHYEKFTDTLDLKSLTRNEELEMAAGNFKLSGYEDVSNRRDFVDKLEAWRVRVLHEDKETVTAISGGDYDRLLKLVAVMGNS